MYGLNKARVSWSLDNQVTTTSVESSYPHHGPKAYKTDSYAFRSVDVSAVVSEAPAFPRLGCGLKRKGVWKALCRAGWGTTAGHFFHMRHSSLRACCLLEMQIKQNRVPVCSSWAFPDLGGGRLGRGVRVCWSSWVQFSVNHKGSRAEKLIVRRQDSCWAHKNSLQHKLFQWSSRGREVLLEGPHGHASSFLGSLWPPDALLQGEARTLAQSQYQPLSLCVVLLHAFLFLSFLTFSRDTTPTSFHCAKPPWTYNPCGDVALVSVVFNTFHFESWAVWVGEETIEDLFSLLMYKLNSTEPWRSSKVLRAAPILPLLYVQPPHGVSKGIAKPPGAQDACRKHCSVGTYYRKKITFLKS